MFYMTIIAPNGETAIDVVSSIFGQACFIPETNAFHCPTTGGLLLPWHVDAIEIPEPFAATLHSQMADDLKKVRKKKEKKNSQSGEVLPLRKKTKKDDATPDGEPPKDPPPKVPKT